MDQIEIFAQNSETFIGAEALKEKLAAGKKLRVKLGVDPTRPDLTFGHMVVFNKLRQFQDLGTPGGSNRRRLHRLHRRSKRQKRRAPRFNSGRSF